MNICFVTCFYGRAEKVERIIRFYLEQDYIGHSTLLLFNNSPLEQTLGDIKMKPHKNIILVNNFLDMQTGKEYTSTGAIFRDAMEFVPLSTDVVNFMDSDDVFLPHHASKGAEGMEESHKCGGIAYKSFYSYFAYGDSVTLEHNNLEPSIFVDYQFVKQKGFNYTSSSYHDGWLIDAKEKMLEVVETTPSLIYDWGKDHNSFKISGSGDDGPTNLKNHRNFETDFGNGILEPITLEEAKKWWALKDKCNETQYS